MSSQVKQMSSSEFSVIEFVKFALVLLAIAAISVVLHLTYGSAGLIDWLRWFMAVFFLVFGTFKLLGYRMFVDMFAGYDLVAERFKLYAGAYPFIELALGLGYLTGQFQPSIDWVTLLIMGVGAIGVSRELRRRTGIHCACLGNIIKLPLSTVSLVEDLGMGLMAVIMIIAR
jgi:hypothetical protein